MKSLKEIAGLFFKLGCISFGGPAAHIAMMEEEVVNRRKWMTREHFLDLIGATNLIPGPNSTEMTMHCGHERGGIMGLFVAGTCFILPAVTITTFIAYLYVAYGQLPQVMPFIVGIKPAVLAIIAAAILKLSKKALKSTELYVVGAIVLGAGLYGLNEIVLLLGAGVVGAVYFGIKSNGSKSLNAFSLPLVQIGVATTFTKMGSMSIFWSFLKVGAVLYGSGYVLFAYLDAELVDKGWLTTQQLIDAVAVGQFTPGPVLSTASFIGYQLGGLSGAALATLGIFLPSFLFVMMLNPLIPRMRKSKVLSGFLDFVNAAAVAVMAAVLIKMGQSVLIDWRTILIALIAAVLTFGPKKVGAMWQVLGGALLGYLLYLL